MSEIGPQRVGGNEASQPDVEFESVVGVSREELDEILTTKHYFDLYLGQVDSDRSSAEDNRREVIMHINRLLAAFGLEGEALVGAMTEKARAWSGFVITPDDVRAAQRSDVGFGELFYHRAWLA